jgi:hypothetical protein
MGKEKGSYDDDRIDFRILSEDALQSQSLSVPHGCQRVTREGMAPPSLGKLHQRRQENFPGDGRDQTRCIPAAPGQFALQ